MAMVFGGSIRFSAADFRSGEYPPSSSYPAHLENGGKVERRTTTLTQGGGDVLAWERRKAPAGIDRDMAHDRRRCQLYAAA